MPTGSPSIPTPASSPAAPTRAATAPRSATDLPERPRPEGAPPGSLGASSSDEREPTPSQRRSSVAGGVSLGGLQRDAAVDHQRVPGDVARMVGEQEADGVADVPSGALD